MLQEKIAENNRIIENVRNRSVFPKQQRKLELVAQIGNTQSEIQDCERQMKLRLRARGDFSNFLELQERIENLKEELEERKSSMPTSTDVITKLSTYFERILSELRFPGIVVNARLDPARFTPIVGEDDYQEIRSNGAIAIIQCAFQFALLEYSLETKSSIFPRFLMLDSPLNSIGKSNSDPDFKDQKIVDAFYTYLHKLNKKYRSRFQLIVCDNGPPDSVVGLSRIHFTGEKNNGRCGLIDDEYPSQELIELRASRQ